MLKEGSPVPVVVDVVVAIVVRASVDKPEVSLIKQGRQLGRRLTDVTL